MKVVYLAAGAAGMICGSCLRDNRLAATLRAQGRDVSLWPLYTPIRTDEVDVSRRRVHWGGIGAYLREKVRPLATLPGWVTRPLASPRLLSWLSRFAGSTRAEDLGALTVSMLKGEHGPQRAEVEPLVEALKRERPDLVNLPDLMLLGVAGTLKRALGVPVVCTLSGEDVFVDALPQPWRSEALARIREAAAEVDAFIAVTRYCATHFIGHFALPADRVHVAPLGVDTEVFAPGTPPPASPKVISYLSRQCREKGLDLLVDAFERLAGSEPDVRLRIAGYCGPGDREYARKLQERVRSIGLSSRVDWLGEIGLEEKVGLLRSSHVFSVPSRYVETKGLPVLEAMSCGVPVVQPAHGSYFELVEESGGGLTFPPGDVEALAVALRRLIRDVELRRGLAEQGRAAVVRGWTHVRMAQRTWEIYEAVVRGERPPDKGTSLG